MLKKVINIFVLLITVLVFYGCEKQLRVPYTVTFIDVSSALSTDHTISIKFSEEKDFEEKYIDILIKSDTDDVELVLFQEFAKEEDKIKLNLNKNLGFVSLDEYKLFNLEQQQTDSMVGYADVLSTTIVLNSNKDAKITMLAVLGDKEENKFKKIGEISKEYVLEVKKKV